MAQSPVKWSITSRSFVYAIGIHLALVLLIGVSIKMEPEVVSAAGSSTPSVNATVVRESELQENLDRIKQIEQEEIDKEQRRLDEMERIKKEAERLQQQRIAEEKKAKELEQKRKEEAKRKKEEEQQRQEEEKKAKLLEKKKKEEAERLKKIELEKKRVEEKRKKEAEEAEQKRKAEEEKRKKAEEEKRRKEAEEAERKKREAEAEKKRQEELKRQEEERIQREEEARIQAQMQHEQNRQGAYSALQGLVGRITQQVTRNWIKPTNVAPGLKATIAVRLTRNGEVINATISESSGDQRFDDSIVRAVLKASPLPFPRDPKYYEFISSFNFLFDPDG